MSRTAYEKRKTVMLTVTEKCNLNCTYCYEHCKSPRSMSFETAKRILDYEFSQKDGFDFIEVDLFGGEPFLEFELLKKIHDYVLSIQSPHRRICFSTSNGTLIHGEVQEWLEKHKESFCVGISLDGNKQMHDVNRSNSFDFIDIPFFMRCWPEQDVKMTVSRESLPHLADGIMFIQNLGYPCSGSFAFGIDWDLNVDVPILEEQLEILAKFYLDNPKIPIAEILDLNLEYVSLKSATPMRWCGAGKQMKAYDVDGNCFPCQSFMQITQGKPVQIDELLFEDEKNLVDPKCEKCILNNVCSTCYGMNYSLTGKINERDKEHCQFNKVIAMFNAYVKFQRLISKPDDDLTPQDYKVLDSIYKLNRELCI